MNETILFVDDEDNILAAFKRQLKGIFEIHTANSAAQGLALIEKSGPYAVVVADMRMPEMNGIEFLKVVKEKAPDSVRMMLTGNADQSTAIDAINQGNIFRFLTKPCAKDDLIKALEDSIQHYLLITSEKELLEKTLIGSITILTDILEMVNPVAFSQSQRIRTLVRHIGSLYRRERNLDNAWQLELAAMLCNIGCVTLPGGILEKVNRGEKLSDKEALMYFDHPRIGAKLTESIPRLEGVSRIVRDQLNDFPSFAASLSNEDFPLALGSQMIRIARDYDILTVNGYTHEQAMEALLKRKSSYNPYCLELLAKDPPNLDQWLVREINLIDLKPGMVLNRDLFSHTDKLLFVRGTRITQLVLERLINYDRSAGIKQPISVRIRQDRSDQLIE